jgi:WD40 repeat protein
MKKILMLFSLAIVLFGVDVKPLYSLKASGGVTDIVIKDNILYAATGASCIDLFDLNSKKKIKSYNVSKITDFMGDTIDSKVYSVDVLDDSIMLLSQDYKGYRRVHIIKDGKMREVINKDDKFFITKAKFLDKDTILLGLLGNVLISYDINKKRENYELQVSQSKFSNFVLNSDKTKAISCDESGVLHLVDLKKGKVIKEFRGQNLDNVFQVDWKSGVIAAAGQDRRLGVYFDDGFTKPYHMQTNFLVYSTGITPDGKYIGYASDELNNITVFSSSDKSEVARLVGNKMTITNILFINDHEVFVTSDGEDINFYKF